MERITTEEVIDKLDMFQYISGKINEFGWWYLKDFKPMQVRSLPPRISRKNFKPAVFVLR